MRHEVEVATAGGAIAIWDHGAFEPPAESAVEPTQELVDRTLGGDLFFIAPEDSGVFRLHVYIDEALPAELAPRQRTLGSFRLRAPSGRMEIGGFASRDRNLRFEIAAGEYFLTVLRQREFDTLSYDATMRRLVGEKEWRYRVGVDRLGALGCICFIIAGLALALPLTRDQWVLFVPVLFLPWFAYFVLTRFPRYTRIERAIAQYSRRWPDYALQLKRSDSAAEVPGGWCRGL